MAATTAVAVTMMTACLLTPSGAGAQTVRRSVEEFVAAQGTYASTYWSPVGNHFPWSSPDYFALIDYAGVANRWLIANGGRDLGTTITGTVTERPLKDGSAEISVVLHTKNAMTLVSFPGVWRILPVEDRPLYMGATVQGIMAGAEPALAECQLQARFTIVAPGAPLPDLQAPEAWVNMMQLSIRGCATGALHEAFGVTEGTPGKCTIDQTGIFHANWKGATEDGFPAEHIDLRVVGR